MGSKYAKTIGLIILDGISASVIGAFLDPVKVLFINFFTSQSIPINELLALIGIAAIAAFTVITYSLILRFKNYWTGKRKKSTDANAEDIFNELIREIERFTGKWKKGFPLVTAGYRRQIERRILWGDRVKIKKHETEIRIRIRSLRKVINADTDRDLLQRILLSQLVRQHSFRISSLHVHYQIQYCWNYSECILICIPHLYDPVPL